MLPPRTSSAIPIVAPGSRTNTPTKRPSTPSQTGPTSPPESPTALKSLGVHAPVFVPRFSAPVPENGAAHDTPQPELANDDPFAASYQHHVPYEASAYTPYYAPLLPAYTMEPLDFHNYHPSAPRSAPQRDYFMTPNLRDELQRKQDAAHQTPYGHPTLALPDEVHAYRSLALLEPGSGQGFFGGFTTSVYRAVNRNDGGSYVLYRIENCRLPHDSALSAIEAWSTMPHPSIVRPHEAFTTRAFNDQSLVVVYDYHPLARTLQSNHLNPSTPPPQHSHSSHTSPSKQRAFSPSRMGSPSSHFSGPGSPLASYGFPNSFSNYSLQSQTSNPHLAHSISQTLSQSSSYQFSPQMGFSPQTSYSQPVGFSQQQGVQPVDERLVWTYLLQLASAIRAAHGRNLAIRCLDPRRVLVTGIGRVRINTVGIIDIMSYDGQGTPDIYLQEDLIALGSLLLQLTSSSSPPQSPRSTAVGALNRFSPLLRQAVVWLITPGTIDHLWKEISPDIINAEMNAMLDHADSLENELSKELENGRLVRLLCKFGFINERPEFDHDPRWAETGDRYIIKLFRDHVFHQLDTRGKPVLNLTHVFTNLSKLDAGSEERLMLVSRDERNCLVVSYKEVKTCIESAYRDLSK
ncbi:Tyrosine kinase domain protein [Ceratobasidium sp. AG-Ba]|nr:Tyrosine kinase domain protein [Ceratobasidium sp. AG-Ba]